MKKKILILEDDPYWVRLIKNRICFEHVEVECYHASTLQEALHLVEVIQPDLIIVDNYIPIGASPSFLEQGISCSGIFSGLEFTQYIKSKYGDLPVVCLSAIFNPMVQHTYHSIGCEFFCKLEWSKIKTDFFKHINYFLANGKLRPQQLKVFIVHGHDYQAKLELKDFLQSGIKKLEPIILDERPAYGRTLIEKFEEIASEVDLVMVLLTPDDLFQAVKDGTGGHQARGNVLYELGYFHAQMARKSGRVILLSKGQLTLPSDIAGIVCIDISKGVKANGELIRAEINKFL